MEGNSLNPGKNGMEHRLFLDEAPPNGPPATLLKPLLEAGLKIAKTAAAK